MPADPDAAKPPDLKRALLSLSERVRIVTTQQVVGCVKECGQFLGDF